MKHNFILQYMDKTTARQSFELTIILYAPRKSVLFAGMSNVSGLQLEFYRC